MHFWLNIWLYVILIIALVNMCILAKNWKNWDGLKRLAPIAVTVLILHVWEEWRIPGGFWYLYNNGVNNFPMSQLTDMLTNFLGIVLGTIVVFVGANNITAIVMFAISAMEVVVHCFLLRLKSQTLFGSSYNPGMLTAIVGFLPCAVFFIVLLIKAKPKIKDILLGIVFAFVVNYACVVLPEQLFSSENSQYAFSDAGYYANHK